jgi:hypothetical protein
LNRKQLIETKEDLTTPIARVDYIDNLESIVRDAGDSYNRYVLSERESHGRRTKIRIAFEAWARNKRTTGYMRLRQRHVVLSLPSAEQAEIAIDIIRQVCSSFDGKHLTRS